MKKILFTFLLLISLFVVKAQLPSLGSYVWNASDEPKTFNSKLQLSFVRSNDGFPQYGTVVAGGGFSTAQDGAAFQLYFPYSEQYGGIAPKVRLGKYNNQGWSNWETFYTSANANKLSIDWSAKSLIVSERMGVATNSPDAKLHVYGSGTGIGSVLSSIMIGKGNGPEIQAIQETGDDDVQSLAFRVKSSSTASNDSFEAMRIYKNGNVGIGTTSPAYKLDVIGTIRAREIKVDLNGADFVFAEDYTLQDLNEVDAFVKENKHLPEIASAKEMQENGVNMGEFQIQLLQKIEELTLYMIDQNKMLKAQQEEIVELKEKIGVLENEN